jgi:molybdopterin converting factor subunit 1
MSSKILVKLLFFAKSRECVGESEVDFEWTDETSVSGQNLLDSILSSYPSLKPLKDCLVLAVNQEYVESHSQLHLKAGDEIAVVPPISGG